nr:integrase, catalytic region, zinc finger, CCHC-type, peptidase aspartic, catalytic [Tanacetum cinerariifolium]
EQQYNLAYFFVKIIESARETSKAHLPLGMFLTRLFRHVMEHYPHLDNGIYDVVERVMRPLALRQACRPQSDRGKARHSVSSTFAHHNHGSSSRLEDDDEDDVIHSGASSVPTDAFMMIYDDMCEPHDQSVSYPSRNTVVKNTLTAELAIYKEHVELYEQRAKFELTEREQKINEQLRIVISDRNFKEETLKKELHSIKLRLASTINHNKSMVEEVSFLKKDFKQKENKYLAELLSIKTLKETVEDKLIKQDQSLQTVHMLCRPRPNSNELKRVAIGYKNPLCLTRAKQVQPVLYNGHEIIKDNHTPAIVHNSEVTLEIAEITRKKMNDKMNDPECVIRKVKIAPHDYSKENLLATFTPQKQLTPEQIFWSNDLMKLKSEPLKERTKALTKEVKEMKDVFEELEAEVAQYAVDRKHDAIKLKNILIANDNLIAECLSQEVFCVATNSELNVARFTEMVAANTTAETRCLALEAELAILYETNNQDNQKELINHFSKLEVSHLNLQLKYQNLKDKIGNSPPTPDKDTPDFDSVFVIGKLQASLQGKDNVIRQLKKQLSQMQVTRRDTDRALHHYKELYDSIKITRAKHIEQVTKLTTENMNLKTSVSKATVSPLVSTRDKHAIDVEPIVLRLRNNRNAHLDYLRHLKENVETIRDIVEEAKVFWDTIQYDKKAGIYRCQLDEQWFVLTKDTLREALQITPLNYTYAFVAPLSAKPVLGYLKFSAKVTKREVFRMPIPGRLITIDILDVSYYQDYQENVAKHRGFLAGDTGSTQDLPAPKPAKLARKPSISIPVTSTQPAPTSALAKSQEYKRKQATKTTDKPAKSKRFKRSISRKTSQPRSSPKSVGALEAEEGPLPPVVIREPELGKYQPLPEVPGKGKAKVTEERVSEPTESSFHDESSYDVLGQSDSEEESEKVTLGAKKGGQDKGQAGPDPDAQAKDQTGLDASAQAEGQAGSNPDETSEGQAGSNPDETSEGQQLDEGFTATVYPNVQENLKLSIDEPVLLEEPASSSGTLSSLQHLSRDFSFGDQFFSDKHSNADKNTETEVESMANVTIQQALSSIPLMTSPIVSIAVSEVVTDAVDWAMQSPLRNRFRDLSEADMKEIMYQRMWESDSYKSHEDHMQLFEALEKSMNHDHSEELAQDLAEVRKKKKKGRESPKTPPGSPSHQPPPPPPPAGPSGASRAPRAFGSQVTPPPRPPTSTSQDSPSKGSAVPSPSKTAAFTEHQAWTMPDVTLKPLISLTPADLYMDEAMGLDEQA